LMDGYHAEQQDSDYLQLHTTHTDRTTLLLTNLLLSVPAYLWTYTAHLLLMMGGIVTRNM